MQTGPSLRSDSATRPSGVAMDSQAADDELTRLVEELTQGPSPVRLAALQRLETMESDARVVIPALIAALKDRDVAVRLAIAQALERRGAPAIAALGEQLGEARGIMREAILNTFVLIGSPARAAVPKLN